LEEAGYVSIQKTYADRLPLTVLRLTPAGRNASQTYRQTMLDLLSAFG
jgi:hypothetical protein